MTSILVVTKDGSIQEREIDDKQLLYKLAGFRNDNGFLVQDIFKFQLNDIHYRVYLYGKTKGKSIDINKYIFYPSPAKKIVGNCLLVHHTLDDSLVNFTINEWNQMKDGIFNNFLQERDILTITESKKKVKKIPKKKDEKNTTVIDVEEKNNLLNTTYLDCSKELTFENFV